MSCPSDSQPILTITTSKNWVLPPRPKNVRKSKSPAEKKRVKQPSSKAPHAAGNSAKVVRSNDPRTGRQASKAGPSTEHLSERISDFSLDTPEGLAASIQLTNNENYQLKTKLLSLIHDYKSLKALVMSPTAEQSPPVDLLYGTTTTARKRVYPEMGDAMNNLISDMSELSHASPHSVVSPIDQGCDQSGFDMELFNFINLEQDSLDESDEEFESELRDEDEDDEANSAALSRSSSPTFDSDENSLMTTLTRSTTVSTTNSMGEKKPFSQTFRFHNLPEFSEEDYAFSFEKTFTQENMMSVIEEDHYNQVADFLEEKLMSNDVQYYVEKTHQS